MTAKEFYLLEKQNKSTEQLMTEFARIKCLEAIRNVRHKAIEIIQDESYHTGAGFAECNVEDTIKRIMNIPNQEVMPEL